MFKLNSIFKIVIVVFLSLVIPSFISIFKLSFDQYVAAQKSDVQGASVVRVQTVDNKNNAGNQQDQSVVIDFTLPKTGAILNLSQRPFKFPTPQPLPVSAPVNNQKPASYAPTVSPYTFEDDNGRGSQSFNFAYAGTKGDTISFWNSNNYDMNNVKIEINWEDGANKYTSIYSTFKIQKNLYYTDKLSNSAEASIPYNPQKMIKSIKVSFTDNVGANFSIKL